MTYDEELRMFKKWLRKQNLNTLAELYALVLFGNYGMDAVKEWMEQAASAAGMGGEGG